jgi:hypothetical protein
MNGAKRMNGYDRIESSILVLPDGGIERPG